MKYKLKKFVPKEKSAKQNKKPDEQKRGRGKPVTIGGDRFNFFPGDELMERIGKLREESEKVLGVTLTPSFVFREGGRLFCEHMEKKLAAAKKGGYHAKPRKGRVR